MSVSETLPYESKLDAYERVAEVLFEAVKSGVPAALWRFKWEHPKFRGKTPADVRAAALELADAQLVVAHVYGFESWSDLAEFAAAATTDGPVRRFEEAVEAVVAGKVAALQAVLSDDPELVRTRSSRRHHATLLHYIAANGVENSRQTTPSNAVEVARLLLDAGAEVDALADMYDQKCTTMSMLVSSSHPADAGVQTSLAELLVDYGAALEGPGSEWKSAVMTALQFGYLETAKALAKRGEPTNHLVVAAGLGLVDDVARLFPGTDEKSRHAAFALAAQHGHADVVRFLLDAGEDPSRYNPEGFHSHSTPLHQAVLAGHMEVARLLVERGARLDVKDAIYQSTPLGWAEHGGQTEIADYLRTVGAPPEWRNN
jgi:ankyrin repeat protein